MRADHSALAALNAGLRIPHRNLKREVALFPFGGCRGKRPIAGKSAHGKIIAVAGVDRAEHLALILRRLWRERSWHLHLTRRLLRHAYFKKVSQCLLNRAQVLLHHLLAFLPVGVTNGLTYGFDRFIARQNFRDGKETDLHDGVHARSHTGLASRPVCIDYIEPGFPGDQLRLSFEWQVVPNFIWSERTVEQEHPAQNQGAEHVVPFEENPLMTGDEVRFRNQIA